MSIQFLKDNAIKLIMATIAVVGIIIGLAVDWANINKNTSNIKSNKSSIVSNSKEIHEIQIQYVPENEFEEYKVATRKDFDSYKGNIVTRIDTDKNRAIASMKESDLHNDHERANLWAAIAKSK